MRYSVNGFINLFIVLVTFVQNVQKTVSISPNWLLEAVGASAMPRQFTLHGVYAKNSPSFKKTIQGRGGMMSTQTPDC